MDLLLFNLSGPTPIVCASRPLGRSRFDTGCFVYIAANNSWSRRPGLREARIRAGVSVHPTLGLILTGGALSKSSAKDSDTVVSTVDGRHIRD